MSQQVQQVLPSQAQPAASTENSAHSNLEPLRVLDALTRDQVADLVGGQEKPLVWPVPGGVYAVKGEPRSQRKVIAIDGEIVYFEFLLNGKVLDSRGVDADIFRALSLPEDQSPISALAKALKNANSDVLMWIQEINEIAVSRDLTNSRFDALRDVMVAMEQRRGFIDAALALVGEEVSRG